MSKKNSVKVYLDEAQVRRVKDIITENWGKTKRAIVRRTLRILAGFFPEKSEEELETMEKQILKSFFHGRKASDENFRPLEPLVAKILYGELGYDNKFMTDRYGLSILRKTLRNAYSLSEHNIKPKYTAEDTLESIAERFGTTPKGLEKYGIEVSDNNFSKSEKYDIQEIPDFDTAQEYGSYTGSDGKGSGGLCYTQGEETWNDYTDNGVNSCFVLLADGWEDEPPVQGDETPYDAYGLSMIWVFLSPEGEITTSNSRWNHKGEEYLPEGKSVDFSFDKDDIFEITGINVYDLFSDVSNDFLKNAHEFNKRMNSGMDVNNAAEGLVTSIDTFGNNIIVVTIDDFSTFVKDGKLLYPNLWCHTMSSRCSEMDYIRLFSHMAENLLRTDGSLLKNDNEWFKKLVPLCEERCFITNEKKGYNVIDYDGTIHFGEYASEISAHYDKNSDGKRMYNGLLDVCVGKDKSQALWFLYSPAKKDFVIKKPSFGHMVENLEGSDWYSVRDENYRYNFYKLDGSTMFDEPIIKQYHGSFITNGFLLVNINDEGYNLLDKYGHFILDKTEKYLNANSFGEYGNVLTYSVYNHGKIDILLSDGTIMPFKDFLTEMIRSGRIKVEQVPSPKKRNEWDFDWSSIENPIKEGVVYGYDAGNGYSIVYFKSSYNKPKNLMYNNAILCDEWYEEITPTNGKCFIAYETSMKYNIIKPDGKKVLEKGGKSIAEWRNNTLLVTIEPKIWSEKEYILVDADTGEILYDNLTDHHNMIRTDKPYNGGIENKDPIPIKVGDFANYLTQDNKLLNNIKYYNVERFGGKGWAITHKGGGSNVVFLDGSVLSDEPYYRIMDGNGKLFVVQKTRGDIYIKSAVDGSERPYTNDMFTYLYKQGLGDTFSEPYKDGRLAGTGLREVGIKSDPLKSRYEGMYLEWFNYFDTNKNDFLFSKFYRHVYTKDGKIFEVTHDDGREDIVDRNENSLIGGRKPSFINMDYSDIGDYEIRFEDDNGNGYHEFYDKDFKLIQRMTDDEYHEWVDKTYNHH